MPVIDLDWCKSCAVLWHSTVQIKEVCTWFRLFRTKTSGPKYCMNRNDPNSHDLFCLHCFFCVTWKQSWDLDWRGAVHWYLTIKPYAVYWSLKSWQFQAKATGQWNNVFIVPFNMKWHQSNVRRAIPFGFQLLLQFAVHFQHCNGQNTLTNLAA